MVWVDREASRVNSTQGQVSLQKEMENNAAEKKPNIFVRGWRGYENGLGAFVSWVARGNGRLGAFTATSPVTVLSLSLVLAFLTLIGFARFRLETQSDVLWVPRTGKVKDDQTFVESTYPQSQAGASFYAQLQPSLWDTYGGDNAIQIPVTWEMFQLHIKIMALNVSSSNGTYVTFNDICYKNSDGSCNVNNGYLWYWYKNFNTFVTSINGSTTNPTQGNFTAFKAQVSKTVYPDGTPVSTLSVFGGTTYVYSPVFQIQAAQVLTAGYTLDYSVTDATAKAWQDAFTSLMQAQLPLQQYMTFTFITGASVGEELSAAINSDMKLIIISLVVFMIIAVAFMSRGTYKTRTMLALGGTFVTLLGILSGWGWGMIFGMPFTPLQQLSPFILLGMGIDVMFILVKSYDIIITREPWLTLPESFGKLMSTAGLSVQVTLLVSAVAFALGSVDDLASVEWFSAFACLNALMILVLMMTTFIACFVLTERRIAAGRLDLFCCWKSSTIKQNANDYDNEIPVGIPVAGGSIPPIVGHVDTTEKKHVAPVEGQQEENIVKYFFRVYYAPALAKWWVKVIVLLFFSLWMAASFYGITKLIYGQPLSDLAPDGSYVVLYDQMNQATFATQVGDSVGIYYRNIDVSDPLEQYKMFKAWDMALQNSFVNSTATAMTSPWLVNFVYWAQNQSQTVAQPTNNCYNPLVGKVYGDLATVIFPKNITGCVPQAKFYSLLKTWLNGTKNNNVVQNADGTIYTSMLPLIQTAPAGDDKYNMELMPAITSTENDINDNLFAAENSAAGSYCVFIYGSNYLVAEGDYILPTSARNYFILALCGVGFVCTFMLVNPGASALMMVAVGLVILFLFSELWILQIKFNQVSVINMIMATGLSVDYNVYFAQKFMTTAGDGTGNSRVAIALADTGFAVFLGGFTALCGSVPMAFAQSVIIRTFFRLIFGTILFSLLIGLVLMPVLFSLIPLPPVKSYLTTESTETDEQRKIESSATYSPRASEPQHGSGIFAARQRSLTYGRQADAV